MPTYRTPNIQATNVPSAPSVVGNIPTAADRAARATAIADMRAEDASIEANAGNMQQADAQREIPRARTDNLNPASGRHLTDSGDTITPPSIFSHRTNRANANRGISRFNPAQQRAVSSFLNPQTPRQEEIRDLVNSHFEGGGKLSDLPANVQRYVRQLDGAIQKVERENDRSHVVYAALDLPDGVSKDEFLNVTRTASRHHQNLLGYTPANHDFNRVVDPNDDDKVYVQIETNRGMYVGGNGGSGHLLPRGLELQTVNVGEFDVEEGNGNTVRRPVIQLREVPGNERTVANT